MKRICFFSPSSLTYDGKDQKQPERGRPARRVDAPAEATGTVAFQKEKNLSWQQHQLDRFDIAVSISAACRREVLLRQSR
jgi:hypothetical protein